MMKENCFVNQSSVNDCGAACLTMILKLHNIKATLNEVKESMNFTSKGVSAYDIVRIAKKKGLTAQGYKNVELDDIKTPAIVHTINDNDTQHFVVLLSVLKTKVLIADPARKVIYVSKDEFVKKYTKIAIMFEESINIRKEILKNKWLVFKIILLTILLVFLNVFFSCLVPFITNIMDSNNYNILCLFLFLFLFIGLFKDVLGYLRCLLLIHFKIITDKVITIPTLKKIINLPHKFYHLKGPGELISKVNDLSYVKEIIFSIVEVLIINLLLVILSIFIISLFDVTLLFINILYILILYFINKKFFDKQLNKTYDLQLSNEKLNNNLVDTFNSITMIKNLSKEEYFSEKITNSYNKTLKKYETVNKSYYKKELLISIIISFFTIFILYILILKLKNISSILFVMSIQSIIINSISEVFNLLSLYIDFKSAYKRVKVIFDEKIINKSKRFINVKKIHFKNISYKFRGDFVLKNIFLDIKKGDWLMVNGKTAAGKSTLFKLLCKQLSLDSCDIFINDVNLNEIEDDVVKNSITYVDQKLKLFNGSIKENIFMDQKVNKKVLKTVLINDMLKENNITLDYVIDNTSSNLSGGGISKIAIAQALALNKDVIIFDETTSNLDIKTESIILNNIKTNYKEKTVILITHRKSNIKYFNKIITLENGKLKINKGGMDDKIKGKRTKKN